MCYISWIVEAQRDLDKCGERDIIRWLCDNPYRADVHFVEVPDVADGQTGRSRQ